MTMLPLRPRPQPEETFASWIERTAAVNGLAFEDFVKIIRERYAGALSKRRFYTPPTLLQRVNPDSVEHKQFIVMMAAATGLTEEFLETFTLRSKARGYLAKFLTPAGKARLRAKNKTGTKNANWYADSYCPACLINGFFLRRLWRPGFPCACHLHKIMLMDECPACRAGLNFYEERTARSVRSRGDSNLLCWRCRLDLSLVPRRSIAPQHRNLVTLLCQLFEERIVVEPSDWRVSILNAFHWWMEAFFQTCTALPKAPMIFHNARRAQQRAAYTYQPCGVRYALFEAACKTIGRVGQDDPFWEPEDSDCMDWLGPRKWRDLNSVSKKLLEMFPELGDQENILAPDRTILPPPPS